MFAGVEIQQYTWDYINSNMYVIRKNGATLVIDPVDSNKAIMSLSGDITVFLTHEHFDHVCGLNRIRAQHRCVVIAQEKCSNRIQSETHNLSAFADIMLDLSGKEKKNQFIPFVCDPADIVFSDSTVFNWNGLKIEVISTPGHSPGSACLLLNEMFFSGDTMLETGPMNNMPGGSKKEFQEITLPLIKEILPKIKVVYPGHGSVGTPNNFDWI